MKPTGPHPSSHEVGTQTLMQEGDMNRLLQGTIWARGAIRPADWTHRNLPRVVLPIYDVLLILAGITGAHAGIPAVEEFFPANVIDGVCLLLSAAALASLLGAIIPRLWLIEVAGKSLVLGLLTAYGAALLLLSADGDATRAFLSVVILPVLLLPAWRLGLLGAQRRAR